MRTLTLVGRQKDGVIRLARFCAWGNHWMSPEDLRAHDRGAPTTHGACLEHARPIEASSVSSHTHPPGAMCPLWVGSAHAFQEYLRVQQDRPYNAAAVKRARAAWKEARAVAHTECPAGGPRTVATARR